LEIPEKEPSKTSISMSQTIESIEKSRILVEVFGGPETFGLLEHLLLPKRVHPVREEASTQGNMWE
jgi:hypothetical protein